MYVRSMNEGCSSQTGAAVKDGLIGCLDGAAGKLLCGLSLDVRALVRLVTNTSKVTDHLLSCFSGETWRSLDSRNERQPRVAEGASQRRV